MKVKNKVTASPQEVARRLIEIAAQLDSGQELTLTVDGQTHQQPLPDSLTLELELKSSDDKVKMEVELSWRTVPSPEGGTPAATM